MEVITSIDADESMNKLERISCTLVLLEPELEFTKKLSAFNEMPKPSLSQEFIRRANQTDRSVRVTGR